MEKRRVILVAARSVLLDSGFGDVAMDDVAREAGVAKGTLFLYFRSKEDLVAAVFEELVDQLGDALEALLASKEKGRPLVEAAARTILSHFERNRDFVSQFSTGRLPGCGPRACGRVLEKFARNYGMVMRLLEKSGLVAPEKAAFAASALFGLCRTAALRQAISGSRAPLERQTGAVVDFFLYGAAR